MTNQCIWKNIKWNNEYNQYWSFASAGTVDSVEFQNLRKCFREVFGLDISFNGNYFEAYIDAGIPTILLKSAAAPEVKISGLQPNGVLKMSQYGSDNINVQTRYADENGEVILEGGTGGTQGSSDIYYYFGEIGIGQLAITTYLFNNERLDNLNLKTKSYLRNAIEIVSGAAKDSHKEEFSNTGTIQAYTKVEKDYESSVNSTISKELLNKIGFNTITIPRYKISESNQEYHFEGLSFPNNRINMNDKQKASGQFCHDSDLQLSNTEQFDAPYWSTVPHIYPEIVFNTHENLVENEKDNIYSITLNDSQLLIDTKAYTIYPNDIVTAYVRKNQSWQSNVDKSTPNWNIGATGGTYDYVNPKHIQTYDATGSFTSTGTIYQLNHIATTHFQCVSDTISADTVFSNNGINVSTHPYWSRLYTRYTTQVELSLKTAYQSSDAEWDGILTGNRLVSFCVGDYSWNGDVIDKEMTKKSDCSLKYTATLVWDAFGTQLSNINLIPTCTSTCYLDQVGNKILSWSGVTNIEYTCVSDFNHITGTYNSILGILPSSFSYLNEWEYEKTETIVSSLNMDTYTCAVNCQIGYKSVVNSSNCGVAIVIWRNGKLYKTN